MLNDARPEVLTAVLGKWWHCNLSKHCEPLNQKQHHSPEDLNFHVECCAYILSLFFLLNPGFPNAVPSK
jgi:hypothetical protein